MTEAVQNDPVKRSAAILGAIQGIESQEGNPLDKKPHVTAVEAVIGFDISADERDAGWAELMALREKAKPKVDPKTVKDPSDKWQKITNNHIGPLTICGTVIVSGETKPVRDWDKENITIKKWLEAGLISEA